jgi:hypothetical protein
LREGLSFEDWAGVGKSLAKASRSLQWWIGDWLNYGVKEYGDRRALAVDHATMFGLQAETLRGCMHVAEKVVARATSLSWSHHREVCGLSPKEQKHWLKQAEVNAWSVSELRQALRQEGREVVSEDAGPGGFNPLRMALDFKRWASDQDVSKMAQPTREALKKELRPVVELWERL